MTPPAPNPDSPDDEKLAGELPAWPSTDFAEVVCEWLPPPPAKLLTVGIAHELAQAFGLAGHAVDWRGPTEPLKPLRAVDLVPGAAPFDAAVVVDVLRSVVTLEVVIRRLASLLDQGGRVVVEDYAADRFDERTARWYFGFQDAIARERRRRVSTRPISERIEDWRAAHAGLQTGNAMLAALERFFVREYYADVPSLYRMLECEEAREQEALLYRDGQIQALGFHFVGRKR